MFAECEWPAMAFAVDRSTEASEAARGPGLGTASRGARRAARSALRELESAASAAAAVLLALLHAVVARQVAPVAQRRLERRVHHLERARQSHAHGAGL